jgi:hypothetical protein
MYVCVSACVYLTARVFVLYQCVGVPVCLQSVLLSLESSNVVCSLCERRLFFVIIWPEERALNKIEITNKTKGKSTVDDVVTFLSLLLIFFLIKDGNLWNLTLLCFLYILSIVLYVSKP